MCLINEEQKNQSVNWIFILQAILIVVSHTGKMKGGGGHSQETFQKSASNEAIPGCSALMGRK